LKNEHKILGLHNIEFPIYNITENYIKIWEELNVVYILTNSGTYILDNKNLGGETLGERRLHINNDLYIPRKTYYSVTQLIRSNKTLFLDNKGNIFRYKKEKFVDLKYYKIKKIKEIINKDKLISECVITLQGIEYPIKINCNEAFEAKYVGLLHTDFGIVLYEYSAEKKTNTRRKI